MNHDIRETKIVKTDFFPLYNHREYSAKKLKRTHTNHFEQINGAKVAITKTKIKYEEKIQKENTKQQNNNMIF